MEKVKSRNIFSEWASWHFYEMPKFLLLVWKNYILFASNYFSLPILIKSFFAPWRRYRWNYPNIIQVGEFLSTLISNFFSRLIGALMRVFLIIAGVVFQIFVIFAGLAVFLLWLLLPLIVIIVLIFYAI